MLRKPGPWARHDLVVPSERTIDRILHRQGLLRARPRKRPKGSYKRFERPGPMQLWQMDIVGGIRLVSPVTGELREAKVVTAVDDHSRYCVIAAVTERATGRAVCLALAGALARFGVPEEIITDNGKQFTDRFGRRGARNGEVLSGKICRKNGINHRLTEPAQPERDGGTLPRHLPARLPGHRGPVHFRGRGSGGGRCLGRALQRRPAAPGAR
jgi:transposase InsO family protein